MYFFPIQVHGPPELFYPHITIWLNSLGGGGGDRGKERGRGEKEMFKAENKIALATPQWENVLITAEKSKEVENDKDSDCIEGKKKQ